MKVGDTVRVRVEGRAYLGQVVEVNRKVHVMFVSSIPTINGHRHAHQTFLKEQFEEYGMGGVDYIIKSLASRV